MTKSKSTSFTLAEMMAPPSFNHEELEGLRQKAWAEQGILMVSCHDRRLSPVETTLIRQIAERLYGEVRS